MEDLTIEDILRYSLNYAVSKRHEYVTSEHILLSLLETKDDIVHSICDICEIDVGEVIASIYEVFQDEEYDETIPMMNGHLSRKPVETEIVRKVLNRAAAAAKLQDRSYPLPGDLLLALIIEEETPSSYFLRMYTSKDAISQALGSLLEDDKDESENNDEQSDPKRSRSTERSYKVLKQYAENLNELAEKSKIDPIIGREKEIREVTKVLARRKKNNAILVGDEGVGKTAIAEGLAYLIVNGTVSPTLKNSVVYSLNVQSLLAGAKYRGEFEERLKVVIDALQFIANNTDEDPILFIDEIHTIKGAGAGSESTLDMANMLKPALNAGLRCIGSTTFSEYRKAFDKDRALARRFLKITVEEPSIEDTKKILVGLAPYFEEFHNIRYSVEAIEAAVELSAKYVRDKKLPDKAIDVIDSVAAHYKIDRDESETEPFEITVDMIEAEVAVMAKIPRSAMSESEEHDLSTLEPRIKEFVFGQDKAIETLVDSYYISKSGLRSITKTIGNFLFAGPTGVGKTEVAKQLSKELGIPLIRFDMSEYMEKHSVAKLIGSPPGYVGYEEEGQLIKAAEDTPHCVLLLDEIEKAHPDVFNILLQVMDAGRLTNSKGKTVFFNNVILIMTTNAGAADAQKGRIGFGKTGVVDSSKQNDAIEKQFTPEFRNRLDAVVMFDALPENVVMSIVDKFVKELALQLAEKNVTIEVTKPARKKLMLLGYDPKMGARPMERAIQQHLKKPLSKEILFGNLVNGGLVIVDVIGDEFDFKFEKVLVEKES